MNPSMVTLGSSPVVAVWVVSLGSPSAFDAFDKIICFICCLSLLVFLCVFVKHPVMMKMTPCYPTDFTPGACFSIVSITETSETQLILFSYVPPVMYCHLLKVLTGPQAMDVLAYSALFHLFLLRVRFFFS